MRKQGEEKRHCWCQDECVGRTEIRKSLGSFGEQAESQGGWIIEDKGEGGGQRVQVEAGGAKRGHPGGLRGQVSECEFYSKCDEKSQGVLPWRSTSSNSY